jgi:hypothetical protein
MSSIRYVVHRYSGRTPDVWALVPGVTGCAMVEVARSRAVLRPTDPSPIPSGLSARAFRRGTSASRLRATRIDASSHRRPGLGQSQERSAWTAWTGVQNPTSADGALARAREYGHGEVTVRFASVRELRAWIRRAKAALQPWSSVEDRERVALRCEHLERGIEYVRSLSKGEKS